MPKVLLTHEQKLEDRNKRMRIAVADGLCITKRRTKMNLTEMGAKTGVSRNTMAKILSGDDVTLTMSSLMRVIDMAGLTLKKKVEDAL